MDQAATFLVVLCMKKAYQKLIKGDEKSRWS